MVKLFLKAMSGTYASLILYALIAAAIIAAFGYTYNLGASHTAAKWQLKYDQREAAITEAYNAEVNRIAQANALAKAIEQKRLAELEAANQALEQKIKEKSDEADADPDRDRPALSSDSGMRIDSIH